MFVRTALIAFTGLALSACAATPSSQPKGPTPKDSAPVLVGATNPGGADGAGTYPLFRYIHIDVPPTTADTEAACAHDSAGLYSRLEINGELSTQTGDYLQSNSFWDLVKNLFRTNSKSVHLIAKPYVSKFGTETQVPLLTIYDENGSKGQALNKDAVMSSFTTPYFRIDPDTTAKAKFEFHDQSTTTSQGVRLLFRTLKTVSGYLAPGSDLFTTLSKDNIKEEANIFDTALSSLLARSVSESSSHEFQLACWNRSEPVRIQLRLDDPQNPKDEPLVVGAWTLSPAKPKLSAFSTATFDPSQDKTAQVIAAMKAVDGETVLNFKLTRDTTLGQYLTQQTWYASSIAELNSTQKSESRAGMTTLCRRTVGALHQLGLNTSDAALGFWALIDGLMPLAADAQGALADAEGQSCAQKAEMVYSYILKDDS